MTNKDGSITIYDMKQTTLTNPSTGETIIINSNDWEHVLLLQHVYNLDITAIK